MPAGGHISSKRFKIPWGYVKVILQILANRDGVGAGECDLIDEATRCPSANTGWLWDVRTSFMSTSSGCSMAKAMARATESGEIASRRKSFMASRALSSEMLSASSDSVTPGEMTVTRGHEVFTPRRNVTAREVLDERVECDYEVQSLPPNSPYTLYESVYYQSLVEAAFAQPAIPSTSRLWGFATVLTRSWEASARGSLLLTPNSVVIAFETRVANGGS